MLNHWPTRSITLSLWLIGGLTALRAILLCVAQIAGGIAGAGLVQVITPMGGVGNTITTLSPGMNYPQGLFLEALLTALLVFTVLMLAAEKHKATFMAPIGIGLTLFVCQLFGTLWTGCGMNPARALGPSVITNRYPGYRQCWNRRPDRWLFRLNESYRLDLLDRSSHWLSDRDLHLYSPEGFPL